MTSAMLDVSSGDNYLSTDSLPFIDLRLLSQSELYSLSLCSSSSSYSSRCDPDLLIPKIDRSVFNESAGSRKQTFSRIRLAPRNSQAPISPHPSITTPRQVADLADHENARIISLLKQLFSVDSSCNADGYGGVEHDLSFVPVEVQFNDSVPGSLALALHNVPVDVVDGAPRKRKRGRPRKNETVVAVNEVEKGNEKQEKKQVATESMLTMNDNGDLVDLASLAILEDPFGEELKRRTQGMETESELLEFMGRLNGEWASQRKKRRIVQTYEFGALFPRGWKIMLSLKRKAGHAWLSCRRYISPDGHQFVSCKEVSSYLLSFFGLHDVISSIASHQEAIAPFPSKMNATNDVTFTPKKDMDACHVSSNSQIHISSACPAHHPYIDPGIERHHDTGDEINGGISSDFSCRNEDIIITSEACNGRGYSGCITTDDKMENAELAMLATTSCLNEINLVHERLDELNPLKLSSNETNNVVIQDEKSGSCSLPRRESEHVSCSMKDMNISKWNQLDNEKYGYVSTDIMPMGSWRGSQLAQFHDQCPHAYHKRNGNSAAILMGSLKESDTEGDFFDSATGEETYVVVSELNNSVSTSDEPRVKEITTNFSLGGSMGKAHNEMQQKGSDKSIVFPSGTGQALDFAAQNNVECPEATKLWKISLKSTESSTSLKQASSEICATNASTQCTEEASYAIRNANDVFHIEEGVKNKKVEDCDTSILFSSFNCNDEDSGSGNMRNNNLEVSQDSSRPHHSVDHSFSSERDFEIRSNCLYGDVKTSSVLKNSSWVNAMGTQKQQQADVIIKAQQMLSSGKHAPTSIASNTDFSSRNDGQSAETYSSSSHMSLSCAPNSDIIQNKGECDIFSVQSFDELSIGYGPRSDSTGNFDSNSLSSQTNSLVEQLEDLMRDAETDRGNVSSGYVGFDKQEVKFSEQSCL